MTHWRLGQYRFDFPRSAIVMGIVNVTPDSFFDGGLYRSTGVAVEHGMRLVEQGAEILDVGGESTRPNATPVSEEEERRRVIPVVAELAQKTECPISVDTIKPTVAREAVESGASIVNDVGANREESSMWELIAESGAGYVLMHMQGTPQTMQANPVYSDVVREVERFFSERLARMESCGVDSKQVVLDVGIGFGKQLEHNLKLLAKLGDFNRLGRPLLLGVSRKSFLGKLLGGEAMERLPGSLACACWAWEQGVRIIRAHDVAATVQALRAREAIAEYQGS